MKTIGKHSGRIEVKPGLAAIAAAKFAHSQAFKSACKFDKIPTDSKFVVFSDKNPFTQFIDSAFKEYCERIREYQSGGYVGLKIG